MTTLSVCVQSPDGSHTYKKMIAFLHFLFYFSRSACERRKACEKMDCSLDMTNNNSGALSMSRSLSAAINQYAIKTQHGYSFLYCRVY